MRYLFDKRGKLLYNGIKESGKNKQKKGENMIDIIDANVTEKIDLGYYVTITDIDGTVFTYTGLFATVGKAFAFATGLIKAGVANPDVFEKTGVAVDETETFVAID